MTAIQRHASHAVHGKNTELRKLLGLESVSLVIKKGRLRWLEHAEDKDDADCVKQCIRMETNRKGN